MMNGSAIKTTCVCASLVVSASMLAYGGPLDPAPGPVAPTGVTLTDIASLVSGPVDGTGNTYFCTKDGIVNPEGTIPTGNGATPLRGFGRIPGVSGTATDEGFVGDIIVESAQEQIMVDDEGNLVRKPFRIRAFRDQSVIGLLRKLQTREPCDMRFQFTQPGLQGQEVVEEIELIGATVCSVTCSPDRRVYIAEFKSQRVVKRHILPSGEVVETTIPGT